MHRRLSWLRAFTTTDDATNDIKRFLSASGAEEVEAKTLEAGGGLVELAEHILANHEAELRRIGQGGTPRWFPRDADRLPLYKELLELEAEVLRQILRRQRQRN